MRYLFTALFAVVFNQANAQFQLPKEKPPYDTAIRSNIFRVIATLTAPHDDGWPLTFSYEREIRKPFTVVIALGFTSKHTRFGPVDHPDQVCFNLFGSGELRYYINLMRRIRKEKPVQNFSAYYISAEHNFLTSPILRINLPREEGVAKRSGNFLYIGYQKQFGRGYFNVYFGPEISVSDLFSGWLIADDYHIGLAFGIVLFK